MTVALAGTVMVCDHCGHRALPRPVGLQPGEGAAQFHACPALGILAPLIPEGLSAHVRTVEREDYVGNEIGLRYDAKDRPIMSVVTERNDGQDCVVFAPTAQGAGQNE